MNVFDAHFKSFAKEILPVLRARKIGVIAMKSLACRFVMQADVCDVAKAINYVLSQPIDTLVSGMTDQKV